MEAERKADALDSVLSVTMERLAAITSFSRAFLYNEAKAGRLKVTKKGKRTVVLVEDAKAWLRAPDDRAA